MSRSPLAVLITLALLGAGCGSDAPTGTATPDSAKAADDGRLVRFAACIRSHGVPDFPDANADGEFVFGINVTPQVWSRAVDACKDLQPPGTLSAKRTPQQQSASLRFADCIRRHGVEDFPDPVNGEPLVDTTRIPSSNRPGGMDILDAAMQSCRSVMAEAAKGQ